MAARPLVFLKAGEPFPGPDVLLVLNTEADMPRRFIDEKTATETGKARRMRDEEGARSNPVEDDEAEPRGLDEDLANPELEIEDDDEEGNAISPPPLDGRFAKL